MYLIQERILAVNLKPGDLFSFDPLSQISALVDGPVNILPPDDLKATGFGHFHVRTNVPLGRDDYTAMVYKVTIVVEDSDKAEGDTAGGTQKTT